MNIFLISSSDPYKTAGKTILFVKHYFENEGHNVKLLTRFYREDFENNIISYNGFYISKIKILLRRIINIIRGMFLNFRKNEIEYPIQSYIQFLPFVSTTKILRLIEFKPDLIFVFFIQQFINYVDLFHLQRKTNAPILLFSPDLSIFTGLCSYSYDCKGYETLCGNCPAISSKRINDISKLNIKSKLKYSIKMNIIGLFWVDSIGQKMRNSSIFKNKPVMKINMPLELNDCFYMPDNKERKMLRAKYNISEFHYVISLAATNLNNSRKGIKDIILAINEVLRNNGDNFQITVITAGSGSLPGRLMTENVVNLGFVEKEKLADLFKVSDVYISASYDDVGPETISLSLSCGVPVISYKVGRALELINHNKTGFLVDDIGDVDKLSEMIYNFWMYSNEKKIQMKKSCVIKARDFYQGRNNDHSLKSVLEKIIDKA